MAFLAALQALCLKTFYRYGLDTCLELDAESVYLPAKAIEERQQSWTASQPKEREELWDALAGFDGDSRQALFAHGARSPSTPSSSPTTGVRGRAPMPTGSPRPSSSTWTPTVDNFLGRVTKARILQAVREARGSTQARTLHGDARTPAGERA